MNKIKEFFADWSWKEKAWLVKGWRSKIPHDDTKDYAHNSSSDNYWSTRIHADSEMDGWKSSIYGFSDNGRIGCGKFPVSASFLRAVGNVGNCKCTFHCDVDHGIYAGRFLGTADYHYEDNQLHQLHIRFPELEKNCKRNCIITDKNKGFYVKIIKDQQGHGFHVSMRSMAFFVITISQSYISWEMTPTSIGGKKQECLGILELWQAGGK